MKTYFSLNLYFLHHLPYWIYFLCCRPTPFTPSILCCMFWLICCLTKNTAVPVLPAAPDTRACRTFHGKKLTVCRTGRHVLTKHLAIEYILLKLCWLHHDRLHMIGCYTVSMNHKVLKYFCFVFAQLKLLTYSKQKARLLSCMSVAKVTTNNSCVSRTPLVLLDCILPHSPTHPDLPRTCTSPPSSPSPLQPINHSSVFLCTLLLYVEPGFSLASLIQYHS